MAGGVGAAPRAQPRLPERGHKGRLLTGAWVTGGGIVFDSDEYEEWMETMNKLGANIQCITSAEKLYAQRQL